jgi:predicted nucleic acid-binding protein
LRKKYKEVLIPQAVWEEVVVEGEGQLGAQEIKASKWIKVEEVKDRSLVRFLQAALDRGESEAIVLAKERGADLVLLDEKDARRAAERIGLRVLGTLGLLIWAKREGHINSLRKQLEALQGKAQFRISAELHDRALQEAGEQPQ